jgi:hypothetical protein
MCRTVRKLLERNIFNVQPEWLLAIRSYFSQGQGVSTKESQLENLQA